MAPAFLILAALTALHPSPEEPVLIRCSATAFDVDLYGRFAIADARNGTLSLLAPDGSLEATTGGTGWGNAQFDDPAAVWFRNGIDLFVADRNNHRIQRFDRTLSFVSSFSTRSGEGAEERFGYPADVALSRLGDLFICDTENARILKVSGQNVVVRVFGGMDAGRGRLRRPSALEIGPADRVYVLDEDRIRVYDSFGNHLRTLGEGVFGRTPAMAADGDGLVVFTGEDLFFFDVEDRPAGVLPLEDLGVKRGTTARALVVSAEDLYILTEEGILVMKRARSRLDKVQNNE